MSHNETVIGSAPTAYDRPSSSSTHDSQLSSETLDSPQPSTAQSNSLLSSPHGAYSTGVLPENAQPLESQTTSAISPSIVISSGLSNSSKGPWAPSSGNVQSESASPTAQTAVEVESQASQTPQPANAEAVSPASESEESLSSTWQVGISPIALTTSSTPSDQSIVQQTSKTGYGGLGSLIWSGLSGSLPTDNAGQVSGQLSSTILTGYVETSTVVIIPSNGFGTGTSVGSGTGPVYPSATTYSPTIQTHSSQEISTGSSPIAFFTPKYSFSWKFNTSTTRQSVGTGVKLPTANNPYYPPPKPSHHGGDNASNATCGGTTVNIPDATLDYWYTTTLDLSLIHI